MKNPRPNKFGVYPPSGCKKISFQAKDVRAQIGTLKVPGGFAWSAIYHYTTGTMAYSGHDLTVNWVAKSEMEAIKAAVKEVSDGAKKVISDKGSVVTPRQKSAAKKILKWCAEL